MLKVTPLMSVEDKKMALDTVNHELKTAMQSYVEDGVSSLVINMSAKSQIFKKNFIKLLKTELYHIDIN